MSLLAAVLMVVTYPAMAIMPCLRRDPARVINPLVHNIALIGKDDRRDRSPSDITSAFEGAQARIYCLKGKTKFKKIPSKTDLTGVAVERSNAFFAFDDRTIVFNRHVLYKESTKKTREVKQCFVEHIQTGTIAQLKAAEFPPVEPDLRLGSLAHHDFAVARVESIKGVTPIPRESIIIDEVKDVSEAVTVVSNLAANNTNGRNLESMTITTCQRYGAYNLSDQTYSNSYGTDCDTGQGSSGAQAYLTRNGEPKLFGLVTGEMKSVPEGGEWDPQNLSTAVTGFDQELFRAYDRLQVRKPN